MHSIKFPGYAAAGPGPDFEKLCSKAITFLQVLFFFFFFLSFVFLSVAVVVAISWAPPAAYGGSQARG